MPEPETPVPVAESSPFVSASVTVKVSPVVVPVSDRLTPAIAVAWLTPAVSEVGAAMTGSPFTVTATCCWVAVLPKPSVAFSVIVSDPAVPSVSCSVARSAFT